MIRVYIYVAGLVLYQFSGDGSVPPKALLAAGGYDHPGLAHVCPHEMEIEVGPGADTVTGTAAAIRFTVPGKAQMAPSMPAIPSLNELAIEARVRKDCNEFDHLERCVIPGTRQAALNGLLEFVGNWSSMALTDCDTGYPFEFEDTIRHDFVRATRAWELRTKPPGRTSAFANAVLFYADVDSAADLAVSDQGLASKLEVATAEECRDLPGFPESATGCIMMIVRNGPSDLAPQGGGDLHFVSLYSLLEDPPSTDEIWLPIKVGGTVCGGGGGTAGLIRCVGGRVVMP